MPALRSEGYEISYIGSYEGIEKGLIEAQKVPYYGISSGKLRRYFDVKNFSDPFKVIKGYYQSIRLLKKIKPDVVFSKGGPLYLFLLFWQQNTVKSLQLSMNPTLHPVLQTNLPFQVLQKYAAIFLRQ